MEFSGRSFRILSRLLRRPSNGFAFRSVTGTAVKEDINMDLLNSYNQDTKKGGVVPVFRRALLFPSRTALQDELGTYTYAGLYQAANVLCNEISAQLVGDTERTIVYMCGNDASHIIIQWAIWMSGNIAVPLTPIHPPEMLKYFISDSMANLAICTQEYEKVLRPLTLEASTPLLVTGRDKEITAQLYQHDNTFLKPKVEEALRDVGRSNSWYGEADAMLIYTSGTTSKPKGVVWTHSMLQTQISSLHAAWQYSGHDVVLHTLPLHHIHGQLNSLNASLAAGARIHMMPSFSAHSVWARLVGLGSKDDTRITVIHGVPAQYYKLVAEHEKLFKEDKTREYVRTTLQNKLRLAVVGSAPLPAKIAEKWEEISGVPLLERYGMSEVGMALSNPYKPLEDRRVGFVGTPLPGVAARLAQEQGGKVVPIVTVETDMTDRQISLERLGLLPRSDQDSNDGYEWKPPTVTKHEPPSDNDEYHGELLLKGPAVFTRYWNRAPKLDDSDFVDGWFRTGDTATYSNGRFRILGRTSIDIIKSRGYKISALQVESALLDNPKIADVAVLGVENEEMGEMVTAVVSLKENETLTLKDLKEEAGKKLAPYQIPKKLLIVKEMPRNAMGKLDKKKIRELYGKELAAVNK